MTSNLLIIIPAYNEEKNIGGVIKDIRRLNYDVDILVINDASKDNTEHVVLENDEKVINHLYNLGYGGALQTGFKYAVSMGYEYVIQFDGDGQHDPESIQTIIAPLLSGQYDIVIGSRFLVNSAYRVSIFKKFAIGLFRWFIKISTNEIVSDPTSGLQGLNRKTFSYYSRMGNFPSDFPDADTLIHMLIRNYRVIEVPVFMKERLFGQSMHGGFKSIIYGIKMVISISVVLLRARLKINV